MLIVTNCTHEDVDTHYEAIRHIVCDNEEEKFKSGMHKAVEEGTAYTVEGSDCFLYFAKRTPTSAKGVAINGDSNPLVTLSMLCAIFENSNILEVVFTPHKNSKMENFISLVGPTKFGSKPKINVSRILKIVGNTKLKVPHVICRRCN